MTVQQGQGRGYNVVVLDIPGIRSTPIMDHIPRTPITPAPASVNPIDKALAQQGQLKGDNGRAGHPRDQAHGSSGPYSPPHGPPKPPAGLGTI
eukprot:scaffold76382_cov73-Attheya_sp.AAC.1